MLILRTCADQGRIEPSMDQMVSFKKVPNGLARLTKASDDCDNLFVTIDAAEARSALAGPAAALPESGPGCEDVDRADLKHSVEYTVPEVWRLLRIENTTTLVSVPRPKRHLDTSTKSKEAMAISMLYKKLLFDHTATPYNAAREARESNTTR